MSKPLAAGTASWPGYDVSQLTKDALIYLFSIAAKISRAPSHSLLGPRMILLRRRQPELRLLLLQKRQLLVALHPSSALKLRFPARSAFDPRLLSHKDLPNGLTGTQGISRLFPHVVDRIPYKLPPSGLTSLFLGSIPHALIKSVLS
ncbi:hypothetical protein AbraIFM66950_006207 [Aspergillus brasiliensis]|nr:hypothetical protein AbraIFM66950_006207 [Aspergillus brasiliensis]